MPEEQIQSPQDQEIRRNPDGTFPPGVSGNPGGRPKGQSLKEYVRNKFLRMSEGEKEAFLLAVDNAMQWQMGEGRPKQSVDGREDSEGNPRPIFGGLSTGNDI